jgi:hypothetical protein
MEQARIRYMQHLGLAPDQLAKAPFIIAQAAGQSLGVLRDAAGNSSPRDRDAGLEFSDGL